MRPSYQKARPTMSEQPAPERHPARNLSLLGVALLVIGAIAYCAVPASSGTVPHSASVLQPRPVKASPTIPGPMPGAPTQKPAPPPPPAGGPRPILHPMPIVLRPANPTLVKAWNSGAAGKALATVTALSSNALLERSTGQYALMLLSCKALNTALGNARKVALIPDLAMQAEYATALGSFQLAAASCILGIRMVPEGVEDTVTDVNQTLLAAVASELSSGASDLFTATELLRQQ